MKLVSAGMLRDGGSLTADCTEEGGSILSILLEIAPWDKPGRAHDFAHLHAGTEIQKSCDPASIIPRGSAEEARLIGKLSAWL